MATVKISNFQIIQSINKLTKYRPIQPTNQLTNQQTNQQINQKINQTLSKTGIAIHPEQPFI